MTNSWAYLDPQERDAWQTVKAFVNTRLSEQGTIDWALKLTPTHRVERIAIEDLLNGHRARDVSEPWASAWRLIEESWSMDQPEAPEADIYEVQARLRQGDRSGALVASIVELVAPRLKVKQLDTLRWNYIKKPLKPKKIEHILSANLTSRDLVDLSVLELPALNDIAFLKSLANALEVAVSSGLNIAARLGWNDQTRPWKLGNLGRVYYVTNAPGAREDGDPDAYGGGIAPSVKLLHAVVAQIAELQPDAAQSFVMRWQTEESFVFVRLWSAMARSRLLVTADVVASFLASIDDRKFWDIHLFPEVAELRAVRFKELDRDSQILITARLRKRRPRNHWPKKMVGVNLAEARLYSAVRELRRIEVGGGELPSRSRNWLKSRLSQFPDLNQMEIDTDFATGATGILVPPNTDSGYDDLQGVKRLEALETALATSRRGWDDESAERAYYWINQNGNAEKVLADLEAAENGGDKFPNVWDRFGWAHRPRQGNGNYVSDATLTEEAGKAIRLLNLLSDETLSSAIEGICAWLEAWKVRFVAPPQILPVWLRLWPIAITATNIIAHNPDSDDPSSKALVNDNHMDRMVLDTVNTPVGKLVHVFLFVCPILPAGTQGFATGSIEKQMRDIVITAIGHSGLIAKYRMIEALGYFLHADRDWAKAHLIPPLQEEEDVALALWPAVARHRHVTETLEVIGEDMARCAIDHRLNRETRQSLVCNLVIESLHALRKGRKPAVPNQRIQQMLRRLDDEVRSSAANAIQKFVRGLSAELPDDQFSRTPHDLFRSAAAPFIREVWPQELSLATPGISRALANLPATSGEAFAEAVNTIARFLVPFDCWSMINYGLYGDEGGTSKLAIINDQAKAEALLNLLNLTVGTSEGAVVPNDLTDALDQIRSVDPSLVESQAFRRLSTAARR